MFFKSSILCKYKICQPWKLHQLESLTDPLWKAVSKSHQQYFFEKEFISLGFWENGGGASHLQSVRERKRFLEQFLRTAVSWDKRILYEFNIILLNIFCMISTLFSWSYFVLWIHFQILWILSSWRQYLNIYDHWSWINLWKYGDLGSEDLT